MLIEIHKVADYLGIIPLCYYAMRHLYDLYSQEGRYATIDKPYEIAHLILPCYDNRTLPNSPLRAWISGLFALAYADFDKSLTQEEVKTWGLLLRHVLHGA